MCLTTLIMRTTVAENIRAGQLNIVLGFSSPGSPPGLCSNFSPSFHQAPGILPTAFSTPTPLSECIENVEFDHSRKTTDEWIWGRGNDGFTQRLCDRPLRRRVRRSGVPCKSSHFESLHTRDRHGQIPGTVEDGRVWLIVMPLMSVMIVVFVCRGRLWVVRVGLWVFRPFEVDRLSCFTATASGP